MEIEEKYKELYDKIADLQLVSLNLGVKVK